MNTVSVIVPIYNGENYISRCLESLAAQVLPDMQIILVNDGSTDGSERICKKYEKLFSNFSYYSKPNGGSASARNLGLDKATGEYIGFVDSDDWIEPDMFQKMYNAAKENEADIVFNPMHEPGENYFFTWPAQGYYNKNELVEKIYPELLPHPTKAGTFRSLDWGNWSKIIKRDIIVSNNIRYFDKSRRCEDLCFAFECTTHAESYYVMSPEKLYHYSPSDTSKSRHYTRNMWGSISLLMDYLMMLGKKCETYDFSEPIQYCILYFCVIVLKNEVFGPKETSKRARIQEIIEDPLCKKAMSLSQKTTFNKEYTAIFKAIHSGNAKKVYLIIKWFSWKKKHAAPIIARIRGRLK